MRRRFPLVFAATILGFGAARADTIKTYNLNATLQYGSAKGTLTLNETTGRFTDADLTVTYGLLTSTYSDGPTSFTQFGTYNSSVFSGSLLGSSFTLDLPTTTLVNYAGGALCSTSAMCGNQMASSFTLTGLSDYITSGTLTDSTPTTTVTPEPSALLLVGTGIMGVGSLLKRRKS